MKLFPRIMLAALVALAVHVGAERPGHAYELRPISRVFASSGSNATQSFEVVNDTKERIALTVGFQTLERDEAYVESNRDADDDFLAYPSQMIVSPGGKQTVRVTWLGNPTPRQELTYRIVVNQVPIETLDRAAKPVAQPVGQVRVLLNYRGTLYIRPAGAAPRVSFDRAEPAKDGGGADRLALTLRNSGSAMGVVKACAISVRPADNSGPAVELSAEALAGVRQTRILAGGKRRYLLPWPPKLALGKVVATGRCTAEP
jgi:fimbrial chaperone protein